MRLLRIFWLAWAVVFGLVFALIFVTKFTAAFTLRQGLPIVWMSLMVVGCIACLKAAPSRRESRSPKLSHPQSESN